MKTLFLVICVFSCLIAAHSFAGSAAWNLNPTSGDWNTAANWTPATVPNGPGDIATFGVSTVTRISISAQTEINSIVFNPGASAYKITLPSPDFLQFLFITGTGIVNNSGLPQNFVSSQGEFAYHELDFFNNATAGDLTVFYNPAVHANLWCQTNFLDSSNAGSCTIVNGGGFGWPGITEFFDQSNAASATITNQGSPPLRGVNGQTYFFQDTNAGTATIINEAGTDAGGFGGFTRFDNNSSVADATVMDRGALVEGAEGGSSDVFSTSASLGNATFIADGTFNGVGAGRIFLTASGGGAPRIELFGTGTLEISTRGLDLTVGSLEGDGLVFLGSKQLTVGTNNLNTTFSGVIQDGGIGGGSGGSLVKIGTGSLTLTGGNTYTGSTLVSTGALLVKNTTGSATGTGAVQINGGILGGGGIISGPVTIGMVGSGTGGSVQPGQGSSNPTTLTLQNTLTFQSDGNYTCKLNSKKAKADQVIASGVTIESGAQFDINIVGNKKLSAGKVFTAISNTAATAISGTFDNLADGSTVTLGINRLEASYSGGDGNDLTLTVVP